MKATASSRVLVKGKETVVRRRGANWSFTLPERHGIEIDREKGIVNLRMPGQSTTFALGGIEETEDEVIVRLGEEIGRVGPAGVGETLPTAVGYPLPLIQDEFQRLRARWLRADLPEQEFDAYPQGATHEDQLRHIRRRLRASRGPVVEQPD